MRARGAVAVAALVSACAHVPPTSAPAGAHVIVVGAAASGPDASSTSGARDAPIPSGAMSEEELRRLWREGIVVARAKSHGRFAPAFVRENDARSAVEIEVGSLYAAMQFDERGELVELNRIEDGDGPPLAVRCEPYASKGRRCVSADVDILHDAWFDATGRKLALRYEIVAVPKDGGNDDDETFAERLSTAGPRRVVDADTFSLLPWDLPVAVRGMNGAVVAQGGGSTDDSWSYDPRCGHATVVAVQQGKLTFYVQDGVGEYDAMFGPWVDDSGGKCRRETEKIGKDRGSVTIRCQEGRTATRAVIAHVIVAGEPYTCRAEDLATKADADRVISACFAMIAR